MKPFFQLSHYFLSFLPEFRLIDFHLVHNHLGDVVPTVMHFFPKSRLVFVFNEIVSLTAECYALVSFVLEQIVGISPPFNKGLKIGRILFCLYKA